MKTMTQEQIAAEMFEAQTKRYAEKARRMTDAEVTHAHRDVSEVFELAMADGRDLAPRLYAELTALQAEAGRRYAAPRPPVQAPPFVDVSYVDGCRLSRQVRVF